jgi:hypothetical protein
MRKLPYSPREPSQSQAPPLYWRGETDDFHQPEYLDSEFRTALRDRRLTETKLNKVRSQLKQKADALEFSTQRSLTFSQVTSPNYSLVDEDQRLHEELAQIQAKIQAKQAKLDQVSVYAGAQNRHSLEKERTFFWLEIERLTALIQDLSVASKSSIRSHSALSVSPRYREAQQLEFCLDKLRWKHSHWKAVVTDQLQTLEYNKPPFFDPLEDLRAIRTIFQRKIPGQLALWKLTNREKMLRHNRESEIAFLCGCIEELNERMDDLGMSDKKVSVPEVHDKYFKPKSSRNSQRNLWDKSRIVNKQGLNTIQTLESGGVSSATSDGGSS